MQQNYNTVQVRPIKLDDTLQVKSLINTILDSEFASERKAYACFDLNDPVRYYSGKKDIFLVAEKDGNIIGTVAIKEDSPDTALLRRVFVHKDFRGQGYGAKLLKKAMEFCFEHDYHTVNFRGSEKMQSALNLCVKQGFQEQDVTASPDFKIFILTKKLKAPSAR